MAGGDTAADDGSVLDSVFSSDRDRGGKSAPPEPQPKEVSPPPEPKAEEKPEADGEEAPSGRDPLTKYRDPETGRFVPLTELKSERQKRQEEARLREEAEKRAKDIEARYTDLERRFQAAQRPQPQYQQPPPREEAPPDPWTDPQGAIDYRDRQLRQQFSETLFRQSVRFGEMAMRSVADYQPAKSAFMEAAETDPVLRHRLRNAEDPVGFVYEEGKRLLVLKEVGPDPQSYRQRIEEDVRKKVLEELNNGGTKVDAQPKSFPGTLADATASGAQGGHLTDEAVMDGVFGSNRASRRRK